MLVCRVIRTIRNYLRARETLKRIARNLCCPSCPIMRLNYRLCLLNCCRCLIALASVCVCVCVCSTNVLSIALLCYDRRSAILLGGSKAKQSDMSNLVSP